MRHQNHSVTARACHRIELAGDWSDLPDFSHRYGGRIVNMAVTIPGLMIEVHGEKIARSVVEMVSLDGNSSEVVADSKQLREKTHESSLFLCKAVIDGFFQQSKTPSDFPSFLRQHFGGGIRIATNSTAPKGSGLGTSSILSTAIRSVVSHLLGEPLDLTEACWQTFLMETSLGLGSGWQDQVGGILPGVKEVVYDTSGRLQVNSITPPDALRQEMTALVILAYTGRTRYSGDILNEVCERLRQDPLIVEVVQSLRSFCDPVKQALIAGDYPTLGDYANKITALEEQLHPGIVPPHIRHLFAETAPYSFGARICGAGGEGFLVIFAKGETERVQIIHRLEAAGLTCYRMSLGTGLTMSEVMD